MCLGWELKCKVGVVYTFGVIYRRDESYPTPRTSYILSKRPGYIWIIGTIELSLTDSRIDEADLTHTHRRAIQKMSKGEKKNRLALIETKRPAGLCRNLFFFSTKHISDTFLLFGKKEKRKKGKRI